MIFFICRAAVIKNIRNIKAEIYTSSPKKPSPSKKNKTPIIKFKAVTLYFFINVIMFI